MTRATLAELEPRANFIRRHIGPSESETNEMLREVGAKSLEEFIGQVVPEKIRLARPLDLPKAKAERSALSYLRRMVERNEVFVSMIGMGYYGTVTPKVILRNVLENPGWYTAYTPYQAEVSQGRLEALLNFQQVIVDLTGLELANASLLDEATAAAEAMAMAKRLVKTTANAFFVDRDTHPQTIGVIKTRARAFGYEVVIGDPARDLKPDAVFAALLSYPGSSGEVRDYRSIIDRLHGAGALAIMATDLLALALLTPPGELGADIAVGSSQRFGVPMGFGGPHAAFFATREEFKRAMPGRIIGVSIDAEGHRALRMAHPARKSHQQYLHRAGSAGRRGLHVRGLQRPQGHSQNGRTHAPVC
jgi:glycine dehydrogenase